MFADGACHVVSVTDPYGRPYYRISSPEPLLFLQSRSSVALTRPSGSRFRPTTSQKDLIAPGIEPGASGSVARNSDQQTTEAVIGEETR
jgi:hypothetical protein